MTPTTYSAYGMQISSAIDLPLSRVSSPESNTQSGQPADVVIRYGDVPTALNNPVTSTPVFQVASREFLFCLPGAGRFLVRDGRDVCVHAEAGAVDGMLGLHLAHSGLAAVLHQRGRQPLHASGVLVDGGCVAFLGGSYMGKSTMAAALNQRGYMALCDDICAVTFATGNATVVPGTGRLQLWADAALALGLKTESVPRAHPEGDRYDFPFDSTPIDRPIPLRRLYILQESRMNPEGISRLSGIEAFKYLFGYTYFAPQIAGFVEGPAAFAAYTGIARSVPCFAWTRPWGFDKLDEMIDGLERHLASNLT